MRKTRHRPLLAHGVAPSAPAATTSGGGGEQQRRWRRTAEKLTIYSSLPLQGAARTQSVAAVNGAKLALEQAGGKAGKFPIKYESLDDSTAQQGGWEPGATSANALQGRRRRFDDRLHRRVQLRRDRGLAADPQRGRHRAGQPGQHGGRHHLRRSGRRARRAGQVLPDRQAHLRARAAQGHLPGRRARRAGQGEGLRLGLHPQRQGGLRRRPGHATSSSPPRRSGWRSRATRASTRTPPTTARSARRSQAPAPSASSTAGSRPTTPCRSSRTWPPRCPTRRCSAPRASARPASSIPRRAACRPTSPRAC